MPMIGQGDYFQTQVNYTQGALKYIFQNPNGNPYIQDGDSVALRRHIGCGLWRHTAARGMQPTLS